MKHFSFLLLLLFFTSCATLFNKRSQEIRLVTNEPTQLIVDQDTLSQKVDDHFFFVKRGAAPLPIEIQGDSLSKKIWLHSTNSFAYISNFIYPSIVSMVVGWYVDRDSPKRYAYPSIVSVDLNQQRDYYDYNAIDDTKQLFKITPLKLVGIYNASVEVAYERNTGKDFSSQLMASWLLPVSLNSFNEDTLPEIKGFRVAFEERYYFQKKAPHGPYFAIELDYLKKEHYTRREFVAPSNDHDFNYYVEGDYFDSILVKTSFVGRHLKFGYQKEYRKMFLDFYVGLGVRTRTVHHEERINPKDVLVTNYHIDTEYNRMKEGTRNAVNVPFNIRVGWRF